MIETHRLKNVVIYIKAILRYLFLLYSLFRFFSSLDNSLYLFFLFSIVRILLILLCCFHNNLLLHLILFLCIFGNEFVDSFLYRLKKDYNGLLFSFMFKFFMIFIALFLLIYQKRILTSFKRNNSNH